MRPSLVTALALSLAFACAAPTTDKRGVVTDEPRARAGTIDLHFPEMRGLRRRISKSPSKPADQPAQQQTQPQSTPLQQSPPPSKQQQTAGPPPQKQAMKSAAPLPAAGSDSGSGAVDPLHRLNIGVGSDALGKWEDGTQAEAPSGAAEGGGAEMPPPQSDDDSSIPKGAATDGRGTYKRADGRILRKRGRDYILDDPLEARQWGGAREMDDEDDAPYFY